MVGFSSSTAFSSSTGVIVLGATSRALDFALVGSIAVVLLAPLIARAVRRQFDPFEPIVVFAIAYGFMFVVRPAAMLFEDALVFEGPRQTLDVSKTFTEMLALALLGAVSFVVAYWLPLGKRVARLHRHPSREIVHEGRLVVAAALFALVGICSFVLIVVSGGVDVVDVFVRSGNTTLPEPSGASMYGWFLSLMVIPASLVMLGLGLDRRSKALVLVSVALMALVAAQASPLGSRITLLPLAGGILVLLYVRRGARPSIVTLVAIGATALLMSTFLSDLRGRATRDETVVETVRRATSPSRLTFALTRGPDTEMAPVLAAALEVIPEELTHTLGTTIFGDLLVRPIPRTLWEEKPITPRHKVIRTIWPIEYERGTINAEFSALLYFYWDLGIFGVILGMALYGVLARYLHAYFRSRPGSLYAQVFYALALCFVVIGLRDSPVDTFVRACFVLAPVWGIFVVGRLPILERSRRSVPSGPRATS